MQHTILVTGGTSGIGFATAARLAAQGSHVLLVGRTEASAITAAGRLRAAFPGAQVTPLAVDLARLDGVRDLADRLITDAGAGSPLDALVLAAAVAIPVAPRTADGLDTTLTVNHLAPTLLRWRLGPHLARPAGRVVLIGSSQHTGIKSLDLTAFADPGVSPVRRYNLTKLLTLLTLNAHPTTADFPTTVAVDPGFVHTRLGRRATGWQRLLLTITRPIQVPPEQPAAVITQAIVDPSLANGAYVDAKGPGRRSPLARDPAAAAGSEAWTRDLLAPWLAA